jgi:hypothetical protein
LILSKKFQVLARQAEGLFTLDSKRWGHFKETEHDKE